MAGLIDLAGARSFLFAPADDERKLLRALDSPADAVIADLEDAVAPGAKDAARDVVASVLRGASGGPLRVLRVNGNGTPWAAADLELASSLPVDAIMVPKATPDAIAGLGEDFSAPVLALVETAAGLRDSAELAQLRPVRLLALGSIDLAAEVGMEAREDGLELLYARSKLAVDCAAAGLPPPVDTVHTAFRDLAGFESQARLARSLGMGGQAVHPPGAGRGCQRGVRLDGGGGGVRAGTHRRVRLLGGRW